MRHITTAAVVAMAANTTLGSVAVTEFMIDPIFGSEGLGEWVELFNTTTEPVSLLGWTLADEDNDSLILPDITIPARSYIVLASSPVDFINQWGVGTEGLDVFLLSELSFRLANNNDEIILSDDQGAVVWNLAYDETPNPGEAYVLTDEFATVNDFGTSGAPGIDPLTDDNGLTDYLGYQAQTVSGDPFATTTLAGETGSPLAGIYVPSPGTAGVAAVMGLAAARRRRHS